MLMIKIIMVKIEDNGIVVFRLYIEANLTLIMMIKMSMMMMMMMVRMMMIMNLTNKF